MLISKQKNPGFRSPTLGIQKIYLQLKKSRRFISNSRNPKGLSPTLEIQKVYLQLQKSKRFISNSRRFIFISRNPKDFLQLQKFERFFCNSRYLSLSTTLRIRIVGLQLLGSNIILIQHQESSKLTVNIHIQESNFLIFISKSSNPIITYFT